LSAGRSKIVLGFTQAIGQQIYLSLDIEGFDHSAYSPNIKIFRTAMSSFLILIFDGKRGRRQEADREKAERQGLMLLDQGCELQNGAIGLI
jgi:two-component sensor histidine kinase